MLILMPCLPRTGSSLVAGILHKLGVCMAPEKVMLKGDSANPTGYFEDAEFMGLQNDMLGLWYDPTPYFKPYRANYISLAWERDKQPLWGLKDARLCYTYPVMVEAMRGREVKVVITERDIENSIASTMKHNGWGDTLARRVLLDLQKSQKRLLKESGWHSLVLFYEEVLLDPEFYVRQLAEFVGVEYKPEILDFIDPKLNHHPTLDSESKEG